MKQILFLGILLVLIHGLSGAALAAELKDITTVSFDESSGSAFPVTFGLLFKKGDVPSGQSVTGRIGSSNIPIQVDQTATHSDGSYRYAILSAIVPSGATTMEIVVSDSAFGGTPVSVGIDHGTTVTIDSTTVSPAQLV